MSKILFGSLFFLFLSTLLFVSPALVKAQGMGTMGMHRGTGMMGGGQGMGMHRGMRMMNMLDLSDSQRNKIRSIKSALRKQHFATMIKMMDERDRLQDLYAKDTPNPRTIGAAYGRIFVLKRQMIEASITARNRMHAVLTPKQKQQMKMMRRNRMGRGMGMGKGGMGMGKGGMGMGKGGMGMGKGGMMGR
jgi:Spy/CpxP family protein refolding chaperone